MPHGSTTRLPALASGWQPLAYAVLDGGTLAVLGTDVDFADELRRLSAAFQASVAPDPPSRIGELAASGAACIWTMTPGGWKARPTFPLETPFLEFDRFGDGRWLVVAPRSDGGTNGRVLAPDGAALGRLKLGDGIEHVAIDVEDRIWIGWFDEGVFGNLGWRIGDGECQPSSNGVACFAADGTLLPLPAWPIEAGLIADCYALNVVGPCAWACPYTEFPLVRLVPGGPARWWRSAVAGPKAIAIEGDRALLAGGYAADADRVALVALEGEGDGEHAPVLATWALPQPSADDAAGPSLLAGRGDTLHLVDDGVWRRWRVRDLLPA